MCNFEVRIEQIEGVWTATDGTYVIQPLSDEQVEKLRGRTTIQIIGELLRDDQILKKDKQTGEETEQGKILNEWWQRAKNNQTNETL